MNKNRMEALLVRIDKYPVISCTYLSNDKMCIIGHMADMAGCLELINRNSGDRIEDKSLVLPAITISEHFDLSVKELQKLQEVNDNNIYQISNYLSLVIEGKESEFNIDAADNQDEFGEGDNIWPS